MSEYIILDACGLRAVGVFVVMENTVFTLCANIYEHDSDLSTLTPTYTIGLSRYDTPSLAISSHSIFIQMVKKGELEAIGAIAKSYIMYKKTNKLSRLNY
jgi:hypothetical protein